MWPGGVYTVTAPSQLRLPAKNDRKNVLTIKVDPADKTDSVKAEQSQKYLFTPESVQAGRLGNT